jgi:DNA adenine methylase
MTSPLRYPGGKTRACKKLDEILNEHFDIKSFDTVVSPFFGGGSFEFYLEKKYNLNIIANDKFTPLYNFWVTCKNPDSKKELCSELTLHLDKITKDTFLQARTKITFETNRSTSHAVLYFIINRCSFSGSTLSGGFSLEASKKRFTKSSIERINKLDLTKFSIDNLDFKEFITKSSDNQDPKRTLLFLDPPYYLEKNSTLYGNNGDLHTTFNHQQLYECLTKITHDFGFNWVLTYNSCDYIKNLYKDFTIIDTSWTYGMNKSKKSSEIVILSQKV